MNKVLVGNALYPPVGYLFAPSLSCRIAAAVFLIGMVLLMLYTYWLIAAPRARRAGVDAYLLGSYTVDAVTPAPVPPMGVLPPHEGALPRGALAQLANGQDRAERSLMSKTDAELAERLSERIAHNPGAKVLATQLWAIEFADELEGRFRRVARMAGADGSRVYDALRIAPFVRLNRTERG